jgi:hypothetical protein
VKQSYLKTLSEAQLDGRACVWCGDERAPQRPVEGSSALSSQLFECVDSNSCGEGCVGPGLHHPSCNAIRNAGACDYGRGAEDPPRF